MTTLYAKNGRRYRPVAESDAFDALTEGWWLVRVAPGSKSMRKLVEPAHAELEAAMRGARDAMVEAMREKQTPTGPDVRHVPEHQRAKYQRAWDAWVAIVGDVPLYFEGVSMHDVVNAGLDAVRRAVETRGDP